MPSKREFLKASKVAVFGVSPKRKTFAAEVEKTLPRLSMRSLPMARKKSGCKMALTIRKLWKNAKTPAWKHTPAV